MSLLLLEIVLSDTVCHSFDTSLAFPTIRKIKQNCVCGLSTEQRPAELPVTCLKRSTADFKHSAFFCRTHVKGRALSLPINRQLVPQGHSPLVTIHLSLPWEHADLFPGSWTIRDFTLVPKQISGRTREPPRPSARCRFLS